MNYQPAKPPWPHQVKALKAMEGRESFALLMAMRTGKTKTLLDDFGRLEASGKVNDLLVIAPAGVYRTWETAIGEHMAPSVLARMSVYTWAASDSGAKEDMLRAFLGARKGPRILLLNVEALSAVDRARKLALTFVRQRSTMIAVDESTTIKTPSARRAKFICNQLGPLASYRRILTGLIAPRSPLDVYMQFYFLDPNILGFNNYVSFRNYYAIVVKVDMGGRFPVPLVKGYRNIDELKETIKPYSFRVKLEDCYDLPPKMYKFRDVTLTLEQQRIYNDIKNKATSQLNETDHVTTDAVITQILRLHQVLMGHVRDETGNLHEIPERRTDALIEILEQHEGKTIIWASYDHDVKKISARLEKEFGKDSVARFWGGNRPTRETEEKNFLCNPKCLFMVATAAAGGRGRTWVNADLVIYYSSTNDLEHRSQSEERAQGIDKIRSVLYIDLRAPGTVEEKIIAGLRRKIDLASQITADGWKKWLV